MTPTACPPPVIPTGLMLGFSADDVSGHLQTGLKGQPPIDAKGLTALRAITNATVHMVIASGGGAETCEPTLANKEQFAQQLLAVSTSAAMLPCGTASRPCGNETKLYNYTERLRLPTSSAPRNPSQA